MIYYEIYFPLTLIFKYNFVKILLLIMFISIKNFNYSDQRCLKEVIAQFPYIMMFIIMNLEFK